MEKLSQPCLYRIEGAYCSDGVLSDPVSKEPSLLEDSIVVCPVCEGRGRVLTEAGEELLLFIETVSRPVLRELIEEILKDGS